MDRVRYFSFNEFDATHGQVVTVSENDILREYYPNWYDKMCAKFGKEHVDATYSFEDCLDHWVIVHYAWEVKE